MFNQAASKQMQLVVGQHLRDYIMNMQVVNKGSDSSRRSRSSSKSRRERRNDGVNRPQYKNSCDNIDDSNDSDNLYDNIDDRVDDSVHEDDEENEAFKKKQALLEYAKEITNNSLGGLTVTVRYYNNRI